MDVPSKRKQGLFNSLRRSKYGLEPVAFFSLGKDYFEKVNWSYLLKTGSSGKIKVEVKVIEKFMCFSKSKQGLVDDRCGQRRSKCGVEPVIY